MRLVSYVLLAALFISSCTSNTDHGRSPSIKDIVNQWTDIDRLLADIPSESENIPVTDLTDTAHLTNVALLLEASNRFYQSLQKFQESDLYRIYRAIPFSLKAKRSFLIYSVKDFPEVGIVSDLALMFRDAVALNDMDKAREVSAEIHRRIISLLVIDGEAQRYINSSYIDLLIALVFFIMVIMLFILFLHRSLTTSIKREAEGAIFSHAYMLAQDEERARISRELHDTVIQDMRCLLLETEKINPRGEETTPKMADLIRKTRDICNSLIPPDFRFSELPDALRQLCHDFAERTGIECRAEIDPLIKLDFLIMEKKLQVYRIVQEALTNIEKHAEAKEAIVTMRSAKTATGDVVIYLGIGDDGKGFTSPLDNSGQIKSDINKSNIGIISMKERAAILGGRLKIVSEIGEGALVCLEIPCSF